MLAVDVSPWLRPDADTCSDRSFCHTFGLGKHQMVPGRTSWTALLDAIQLEPGVDLAAVTAGQVHDVIERLVAAGQWRRGDPEVLVLLDAAHNAPPIAHLLVDMPVEVLGRLRSDRVMRKPVPVPTPGTPYNAASLRRTGPGKPALMTRTHGLLAGCHQEPSRTGPM
nr:transposase [Streptomyces hyaluromycini]